MDALRHFELEIQLPVVQATTTTQDPRLKDRRSGRVSEGKRRLTLAAAVLAECIHQRPEIRDARIKALYDVPVAELTALGELVDYFMGMVQK